MKKTKKQILQEYIDNKIKKSLNESSKKAQIDFLNTLYKFYVTINKDFNRFYQVVSETIIAQDIDDEVAEDFFHSKQLDSDKLPYKRKKYTKDDDDYCSNGSYRATC